VRISQGKGTPLALYVTGWSWSAYAYRLQTSLRSSVAAARDDREKMPLLYVYVVVDGAAYAARDSPDVNIETVVKAKILEKVRGAEPVSEELEITGRPFGLGAARLPDLGEKTALVVLRSET